MSVDLSTLRARLHDRIAALQGARKRPAPAPEADESTAAAQSDDVVAAPTAKRIRPLKQEAGVKASTLSSQQSTTPLSPQPQYKPAGSASAKKSPAGAAPSVSAVASAAIPRTGKRKHEGASAPPAAELKLNRKQRRAALQPSRPADAADADAAAASAASADGDTETAAAAPSSEPVPGWKAKAEARRRLRAEREERQLKRSTLDLQRVTAVTAADDIITTPIVMQPAAAAAASSTTPLPSSSASSSSSRSQSLLSLQRVRPRPDQAASALLRRAQQSRSELQQLPAQEAERALQRRAYDAAMLRAAGEAVRDDVRLLKRSVAKAARRRRQSEQDWQSRKAAEAKDRRQRVDRRQANIDAKIQRRKQQRLSKGKRRRPQPPAAAAGS